MSVLLETVSLLRWQHVVMWAIGGILIYLAIRRKMEPALLLPMGFGAILVNLPLSGAVTQIYDGAAEIGALDVLFDAGVANELFPLLLFIGIGAMIDFTPLLSNPKLMIFGAAAQFGIFFTLLMALLFGFDLRDAVSVSMRSREMPNTGRSALIGRTRRCRPRRFRPPAAPDRARPWSRRPRRPPAPRVPPSARDGEPARESRPPPRPPRSIR